MVDTRGYSPFGSENRVSTSNRSLNVDYGYILEMISDEESPLYLALVLREYSIIDAMDSPAIIPLEDSPEYLVSTFGLPIDLVGLRVRVEYIGSNWKSGVARIVPGRSLQARPNIAEIPSRGFRYATPGSTSRGGS